jgi:hypothetical protein
VASIPIAIYANQETIKNKLFKKILKTNNFDKIDHKIYPTSKLTEDHIKATDATLTVIMGEGVTKTFNDELGDKFESVVGKGIKYKDIKLMITYDLDEVCSELDFFYSFVEEQFTTISKLYFKNREKSINTVVTNEEAKCHSFKLPDWCYDSNHILIDIQYNKFKSKILYVFRDANGN